MPTKDLFTMLDGVTVSGILVAIIYAALNKKIVSGWLYLEMKADRDSMKAERDYWMNKFLDKVDPPKEVKKS